jgi:hypothetical protein
MLGPWWTTLAVLAKVTWAQSSETASQVTAQSDASDSDVSFPNYLLIMCGGLVVVMVVWRVLIEFTRYVRHLACLTNERQIYFRNPSPSYASFKKAILYAPLFSKRHNREFQLSSAINMGTLPTRIQFLFLAGYLGTNVIFCVLSIHWSQPFVIVAGELRTRAGILAVVNMIPLFIMATRNNPLISWLKISFDTFNLLHRWFGRIVVLESLVHTGCWVASTVKTGGWSSVAGSFSTPLKLFGCKFFPGPLTGSRSCPSASLSSLFEE